jgi:heterodisulfide reductase subunit B
MTKRSAKPGYAYFPGCCADSSGAEYMQTTEWVFERLGLGLQEIEDWNCCGASSAHAVSEYLALALPGRDLARAEQMQKDVVAPCAACFNRLATAARELPRRADLGGEPLPAFRGDIQVLHPMRVLSEPAALERLREQQQRSLAGLTVVTYYGCLVVRPAEVTGAEGSELENPTAIDRILQALGAEVRPWSHKTSCCGAAQAVPNPELTRRLTSPIVAAAREAGAEAVVTGCPLCFLNLELQQQPRGEPGEQDGGSPLPVFYFTELMALALGDQRLRRVFKRHLVPVRGVLEGRQLKWA